MGNSALTDLLKQKSVRKKDAAERELMVIDDRSMAGIADGTGVSVHLVAKTALENGISPLRYIRNRSSISMEEQLTLARSRVVVVGAGGLGGHVIMLLARTGVGHLTVVDHDLFDETNLNRQMFATVKTVGKPKAEIAAKAVAGVNPAVTVVAVIDRVDGANAGALFRGADLVVDALDNVPDRLVISEKTQTMGIPLVHGALAGFEGQVMDIFPGDPGLSLIYGDGDGGSGISAEALLGVPGLTPSVIGTLQAMEVIKILLSRGKPLRNRMVHVGLEEGELNHFTFEP